MNRISPPLACPVAPGCVVRRLLILHANPHVDVGEGPRQMWVQVLRQQDRRDCFRLHPYLSASSLTSHSIDPKLTGSSTHPFRSRSVLWVLLHGGVIAVDVQDIHGVAALLRHRRSANQVRWPVVVLDAVQVIHREPRRDRSGASTPKPCDEHPSRSSCPSTVAATSR